ncbi:MAG TPA: hypothetical protein VH724_08500 [Candidatus Angelobacter sp.]|nr:hypothetical protein [Candidatus Angelobacter sp.]
MLNWLGLPLLALLAAVLLFRRWYKIYPFFLFYIVTAEAVGLVRLAALKSPSYNHIYWVSDTFLAVAAFLATYELFFKRLFPAFYRTRLYRLSFPGAAILVTAAAILNAVLGGHYSTLGTAIHIYEFLRGMMIFLFVLLMIFMGRQWDKQEFGIAFGFGLDVSTSLLLHGSWMHTSGRSAILAMWSVIAYDLACIVWLYCFWSRPNAAVTPPPVPPSPEVLLEATKWEKSLKDLVHPEKR